jgi:hypothetical protein
MDLLNSRKCYYVLDNVNVNPRDFSIAQIDNSVVVGQIRYDKSVSASLLNSYTAQKKNGKKYRVINQHLPSVFLRVDIDHDICLGRLQQYGTTPSMHLLIQRRLKQQLSDMHGRHPMAYRNNVRRLCRSSRWYCIVLKP